MQYLTATGLYVREPRDSGAVVTFLSYMNYISVLALLTSCTVEAEELNTGLDINVYMCIKVYVE
jgi:hypothetical protein